MQKLHRITSILLLTGLLFFLSSNEVSAQTVWQERFDSTLSSWEVSAPAGDCTVEIQSPTASSPASPDGGNNLLIFKSNTNTSNCYVARTISPPLENGTVTLWFYDNLDSQNTMEIAAALVDNTDHRTWIGVRSSISTSTYNMIVDDEDVDTNVIRSAGWHKFSYYVYNGETFTAIDDRVLRYKGYSKILRAFTSVKLFAGFGARGAARFDGIQVSRTTTNYQEQVIFSPNNSSGWEQKFTTRIKSITGTNYFNNIFVALTDTAPEESNTDVSLWYGIIKSPTGSFRFYAPQWIGTTNIGNPNIGWKEHYTWNVGGSTPGTQQLICTNTNRKASIGQTASSIGCLDVSRSTISWNAATSELIIDWYVIFNPNFTTIRSYQRDLPIIATSLRKIRFHVNIDETMGSQQNPGDLWSRYNWREVGTYSVGTVENHSTMNPNTLSGDISTIQTTFNHPTQADQITEGYIWFDEIEPSSNRSDVAVVYSIKKNVNQYQFFGRRFTQDTQVCPKEPINELGTDCYLNYAYDVGGFSPGQNQKIFYNLNRISTTNKTNESTSFLNIALSTVTINPQDPKQLLVSWNIGFLKTLGNRNFRVFVRWIGTQGNNGQWQEIGKYTVTNPKFDHGKIEIAQDNRHLQFADGKPYSWVGYNMSFQDRIYTKEELDGHLAKLAMYNINYVRIMLLNRNPMMDMIKYFADRAYAHGIYLNIEIFQYPMNGTMMSEETYPYRQSRDFVNYLFEETKDKKAIFMWEMTNDQRDYHNTWVQNLYPYMKANDPRDRLISLQLSSSASFTNPQFAPLVNSTDLYSVRLYNHIPSNFANQMQTLYDQELTVSPPRPIYFGESRLRNDTLYNWRADWETLWGPAFNQASENMLNKGLAMGVPQVHLWAGFFRKEYLNPGEWWGLFPPLSNSEFRSFLRFPPHIGVTDLNKDTITNGQDINLAVKQYNNQDPFTDLLVDNKTNVFDLSDMIFESNSLIK